MATFYITIDGAYKGDNEDIANMKKRLGAILKDKNILDDGDRLRELFGDELEEIPELNDVDDEKNRNEVFGGLRYKWEMFNLENLQFEGYSPGKEDTGDYILHFLNTVRDVFSLIEFDFISCCYYSWGHYTVYIPGDEDEIDYEWDEEDGGEKKKDAYIKWKLAERKLRFLPDDATDADRNTAQKKLDKAEAAFNRINDDEDEENDDNDDNISSGNEGEEEEISNNFETAEACFAAIKDNPLAIK